MIVALQRILIISILLLIRPAAPNEESTTDALGGIAFDELPKNLTIDEGETLEEEWVRDAILDLAYYVRSHKFNEFDRRYKTEENAVAEFYKKFPEPPLRTFHWEVSKFCASSLVECLRYATEITTKVKIGRSVDTVYKMSKEKWTRKKNKKQIEKADKACKKIYKQDWETGEPFQGPLQRFQWRTTISYYMCKYTLEGLSELSAFGERCDNYANCLWSTKTDTTGDPRADDSKPFACAKYSFCPDPCCPARNISDSSECQKLPGNPCPRVSQNQACSIPGHSNLDVRSLALNHWNYSCSCDEEGHVFDSRFGICVDIDECELGADSCNNETESCLNLRGSYRCICSFGHKWDVPTKSCIQIQELTDYIKPPIFELNEDDQQNRSRFWKKTGDETSKAAQTHSTFHFLLVISHFLIILEY